MEHAITIVKRIRAKNPANTPCLQTTNVWYNRYTPNQNHQHRQDKSDFKRQGSFC